MKNGVQLNNQNGQKVKRETGNRRGEVGAEGGCLQVSQREGISGEASQTLKEFARQRRGKWFQGGEEGGFEGRERREKENFYNFIEGDFRLMLI
mgnify:CR=1 FL=1